MFGSWMLYGLIGIVCIVGVTAFVRSARKAGDEYREYVSENEEIFYPSVFPTTEEVATVIDHFCYVETVGFKHPKTMQRFVVVFETEGGVRKELLVEEAMYDGFEIGQQGLLTTVEGELYGFAPD